MKLPGNLLVSLRTLYRDLFCLKATAFTIPASIKHLAGPADFDIPEGGVVALVVIRDGYEYLDEFINYYDSLGVSHYVFLDNGSRDGTIEALEKLPNLTLIQSLLPYSRYFHAFKRYLIKRYALQKWFLLVDADEFFVYPGQDEISLETFIGYLRERSFDAVPALMLDMYSDGPLDSSKPGTSVFRRGDYPYFELSSMQNVGVENGKLQDWRQKGPAGGVRSRCFGISPLLLKHPLIFGSSTTVIRSDHYIRSWMNTADVGAALLHYKFTRTFRYFCEKYAIEGNHYNNSIEYKGMDRVLKNNNGIIMKSDISIRYENNQQLLGMGVLIESGPFRNFVHALCPDRHGAAPDF